MKTYILILSFLATSHAAKTTMFHKMMYQPDLHPQNQTSPNPLGELHIPQHQKQAIVDDYIAKRVQQAVDWAHYKADLRLKEQNQRIEDLKKDLMARNADIIARTKVLIK